jgi:hypothetical protein
MCILLVPITYVGARCWWRSWLRHCDTSWKVAGSIPYGVIGIFEVHSAANRNEYQECFLGVKAAGA